MTQIKKENGQSEEQALEVNLFSTKKYLFVSLSLSLFVYPLNAPRHRRRKWQLTSLPSTCLHVRVPVCLCVYCVRE